MERVNKILSHHQYKQLIHELGKYEKDRPFCKHGIEHLLSVARIMLLYAYEKSLSIKKENIYAVALLHDIGRVSQYKFGTPHAQASAELSIVILKDCGYSNADISSISIAIASHNQEKDDNPLGELLRYADKLSRNCFCCNANVDCNWTSEKKNKGVTL
jgi:uncharacterized protein